MVRAKPQPPAGLQVAPEQAPELWSTVRELATEVGTRAPDEIRLIPEVNAAVRALRGLPVLDSAWSFYFDRYVGWGWEAGFVPDDIFGGFPPTSPGTAVHPVRADRVCRGAEAGAGPVSLGPYLPGG